MLKPYYLIALFCVFIGSQKTYAGSFTTNGFNAHCVNFQHLSVSIQQDSLAKKKIDSLTKALATQKAKAKTILQKLVQPFKFKANRKDYISTSIHDYIVTDSIQAVKQLANLSTSVSRIQNNLVSSDVDTKQQLAALQQNISAVKAQLLQQIANISKATQAGNAAAPIDTPVKEKNQPPVIATENTNLVTKPVKAEQDKLNTLRLLYNGPITYRDTSKKKDTVYIKSLSLAHKVKILGFYADTSHADLNSVNFKLISNFVFAVNPFEGGNGEVGLNSKRYIIDSALKAKCGLTLSIYNNPSENISAHLGNTGSMNSLIKSTLILLDDAGATGININFNGLTANQHSSFVTFIKALYYKVAPKKYTISITIPAGDKGVAYNLNALNPYVTNFIIDFSKVSSTPGALEPLNNGANNSVETCLSLYLNKRIDPAKFILEVSYSGVVWQKTPQKFMHYIAYNWVRANYSDDAITYKKGESAAHIETPYNHTYLDIWYDDEITLGEKYDYAIANKLGGIAIKSLGDDDGYAELQDNLAIKLLKVDTTVVGLIIIKHTFITTLTTIIDLLTKNPCDQEVPPGFSKYLLIINLLFILLIAVSAGILYYNVKKYSESWKWRKQLIYLLLGLFIVWSFFLLMWLFFSSNFPYFGPSHKFETDCVTVPFIVLYLVLTTGIGLGILTWWLYKLNNEDDVP